MSPGLSPVEQYAPLEWGFLRLMQTTYPLAKPKLPVLFGQLAQCGRPLKYIHRFDLRDQYYQPTSRIQKTSAENPSPEMLLYQPSHY